MVRGNRSENVNVNRVGAETSGMRGGERAMNCDSENDGRVRSEEMFSWQSPSVGIVTSTLTVVEVRVFREIKGGEGGRAV